MTQEIWPILSAAIDKENLEKGYRKFLSVRTVCPCCGSSDELSFVTVMPGLGIAIRCGFCDIKFACK